MSQIGFFGQMPRFGTKRQEYAIRQALTTVRPVRQAPDAVDIRFGHKLTPEQKARRFADYHGKRIHQKMLAIHEVDWDYVQYGGEDRLQKIEEARNAEQAAWRNTRAFRYLQRLINSNALSQIKDVVLKRNLEVLAEGMRPAKPDRLEQMEMDLMARGVRLQDLFNRFPREGDLKIGAWKPEGVDNTYGELLLGLVKDRNALARLKGFGNYYSYQLAGQNFNEQHFNQVLQDIKTTTDDMVPRLQDLFRSDKDRQALDEWKRILLDYLRKLEPEEMVRKTAGLMGLSVEQILANSDLYVDPERPGKTKGGFCGCGDLPQVVRTIANIPKDPQDREMWHYQAHLLHEVIGHGLDFQFIDPKLPPLLRDMYPFSAEGQAMTFESLIDNKTWLSKVIGIPKDVLLQHERTIKLAQLDSGINSQRWLIAQVEFERALYENPNQDLDELYKQKLAEFWQIDPNALRKEVGAWADTMHFTSFPAYQHNYLLGEAWRAQVVDHINRNFGGLLTKEAARFLKQHRSAGKLHTWPEQIQRMTGKPLSADALVKELLALEKDASSA